MASNPHALAISLPLQGHINPLVQLCNRLVSKGICVTYVTTATLSKNLERYSQQEADDNNLISIETVPDSPADEVEGRDIYEVFFRSFEAAMTSGLPDIITKHSNSGEPLKAIVYDSCIPWMSEFAHKKGLKAAMLLTQSAAVSSVFYHVYKGRLEISHDASKSEVFSFPGLPAMGVQDLPSLLYSVGGYGAILRILVEQFSTFEKADRRLMNTFYKLEDEVKRRERTWANLWLEEITFKGVEKWMLDVQLWARRCGIQASIGGFKYKIHSNIPYNFHIRR